MILCSKTKIKQTAINRQSILAQINYNSRIKSMNLLTSLLSNQEEQDGQKSKEKSFDLFCCFHAKDYFNIEQETIIARIKSAIFLRPTFSQVMQDKPDLYGPFWISTTLIIVIIASSSLMKFFHNPTSAYNFNQLAVAAQLIYGIAFGSPYVIAVLLKIFGGMASVVDLICIYGYSLTSFLPVTALCFINSTLIQTVALILAFLSSSVFLIRGILGFGQNLGEKQKGVLAIFILCVQLTLVFMYKFYFFDQM